MLPKTGINLRGGLTDRCDPAAYAAMIGFALQADLGNTHRAVKTIRQWTGAGERTVTNWLAADNGPSGPHLAMLAHHSDAVLRAFLVLAGRERVIIDLEVAHIRAELVSALETIDRLASGKPPPQSH